MPLRLRHVALIGFTTLAGRAEGISSLIMTRQMRPLMSVVAHRHGCISFEVVKRRSQAEP